MAFDTLTEEGKALIEHLCSRLVIASIAANDRQDYDAFAAYFTADGLLHRPSGEPLRGQEQIAASYRLRPPSRITRHVCTNILVDVDSAEDASGITYVVLYTADSEQSGGNFGVKCEPRRLIGELEDRFRCTDAGWRIAERRARFVMHT